MLLTIKSNYFDTKILSLEIGEVVFLEDGMTRINSDCLNESNYNYLYSKVKSNKLTNIRLLEDNGFRYVETLLEFGHFLTSQRFLTADFKEVTTELELEEVLNLSDNCFTMSRYHRDPYLPVNSGKLIYREWIKNTFNKSYGDVILIPSERKIDSFSCCRLREDFVGVIDLTGSSYLDGSIDTLIYSCLNYFIAKKSPYALTYTQSFNTSSISQLQRCGFKLLTSYVVLSRGHDDYK